MDSSDPGVERVARRAIERTLASLSFQYAIQVSQQEIALPGEDAVVHLLEMSGVFEAPDRLSMRIASERAAQEVFLTGDSFIAPAPIWEQRHDAGYRSAPRRQSPHPDPVRLLHDVLTRGTDFRAEAGRISLRLDGEPARQTVSVVSDRVVAMTLRFGEPHAPMRLDVSMQAFDDPSNPRVVLPDVP